MQKNRELLVTSKVPSRLSPSNSVVTIRPDLMKINPKTTRIEMTDH